MILVLAGTGEGRRAASLLAEAGFNVVATAVSEYGGELLKGSGVKEVLCGSLSREELSRLLERGPKVVVDATHPYAVNITESALDLCREKGLAYIRLERPAAQVPEHPLVFKAYGLDEALDIAAKPGEVIFSTIGSKNLYRVVEKANQRGARVIARVLPDPLVLNHCFEAGLNAAQVIALQGPFSRGLNRELYSAFGTTTVITKESGDTGGFDTKVQAALDLGVKVVVWMRPAVNYPGTVSSPEELLNEVKKLTEDL